MKRLAPEYETGGRYGAYTLISRTDVPEYESVGLLFRHLETGCEVYHLVNTDDENLFAFIFKTPPHDSRGTAHIIEHAVLSGSQRYPIKDPFITLSRGSMNTFLNAMTYPDKTIYPASSTVKRDFFNLFEVYGDSVFHPLLRRESFHQEGRRYLLDEHGRLEVDGVVYSEMQGNYSSHDSIAGEWSYRSLFPDSPYRFDSGGEPEAIRDLSYEEFLTFHRTFYHPSNCRVFLYGNIPSSHTLRLLDERFLGGFGADPPHTEIPLQPRLDTPRSLRLTSPADDDTPSKNGSTITINWLTVSVHDPLLVLSLEILTEILLGHSGSPLHQAIVESGIGEDISPVSGLETQTLELVFSVGVRGTDPDREGEFVSLVESVLRTLVTEGIPKNVVTGAMNRVEFRNREIKGGAPFGLRLLAKAVRGWLHGDPPERTLEFEPWMVKVSEHASRSGYFESLIEELLLENRHRSTVIVTPDARHEEKERERFRAWREARLEAMSEEEKRRIHEDAEIFASYLRTPDRPEDLASVPSLELDDAPTQVDTIPSDETDISGVPAHVLEHYTHGVVYATLAFDIGHLSGEVGDSLPLLCRALCGAGLPGVSYDEVARRLSIHTGGFSSSLEANTVLLPDVVGTDAPTADASRPEPSVTDAFPRAASRADAKRAVALFRVKALEAEFATAVELVFDLLTGADLADISRVRDLLLELRNDFRSEFLPAGHSFALVRAGSVLSEVLAVEEGWKGLSQYLHLNEVAASEEIEELAARLEATRREVLNRSALSVAVAGEEGFMPEARRTLAAALERIPEGPGVARITPLTSRPDKAMPSFESLVAPTSVGYVAQVFPASRYGETEHAAEVIVAQLLKSGFLWEQVRMQGGAYGVFAHANGGEGLFSFSSYRDPRIVETFEAFRAGVELLARKAVATEELEKAIITIVGREIRPLSPAEKSMISFRRSLYGITDELRQAKRDDLLSLEAADISRAAERLLAGMDVSSSAVLAGRAAIDEVAGRIPELARNSTVIPMR